MSEALNQWLGLALFVSFYLAFIAFLFRAEINHKPDKRPRWRITIIQATLPKESKKVMTLNNRILRRSPKIYVNR